MASTDLKSLENCPQGILFSGADCAKTHWELVRLWLHESARVYRDKLVDLDDIALYDKTAKDVVKKTFEVRTATGYIKCCNVFGD